MELKLRVSDVDGTTAQYVNFRHGRVDQQRPQNFTADEARRASEQNFALTHEHCTCHRRT
jgi:hypothetical protein